MSSEKQAVAVEAVKYFEVLEGKRLVGIKPGVVLSLSDSDLLSELLGAGLVKRVEESGGEDAEAVEVAGSVQEVEGDEEA